MLGARACLLHKCDPPGVSCASCGVYVYVNVNVYMNVYGGVVVVVAVCARGVCRRLMSVMLFSVILVPWYLSVAPAMLALHVMSDMQVVSLLPL
jgi:hypothetical protein